MMAKEIIMASKKKVIDPLPDSFATEEEAGEFWDTHSTMDYAEFFVPADHEIKIEERVYEVHVAEDVFQKLQQEAKSRHQSVPKTVDQILRKELTTA